MFGVTAGFWIALPEIHFSLLVTLWVVCSNIAKMINTMITLTTCLNLLIWLCSVMCLLSEMCCSLKY